MEALHLVIVHEPIQERESFLVETKKGRSVCLLPAAFISIISKSTFVPRMSQATRKIHQHIESEKEVVLCVNFITGPSNSADIEINGCWC
ncbi:L-lactate utilization protein LutC [Virgibacillus natechei]|uniref:L-lactate utilization protein LutC n=1 Tax=Virgibacillus natechei TaxID=1216297 RepID=A0ABS4IFI5_9BACI|nr:LUD domain-containing protein [Virgibacillus natechei]MBP1969236.1 L-lactate utilization protein LutC [Virgibacillus natechei]UZD12397.1 LUD domain-containing protein [Virgibacillus natechei]